MRILVTYQYYLPAYKAGGPIQSIANITKVLGVEKFQFYILCSDKDLDNSVLDVTRDKWVNTGNNTQVYYMSGKTSDSNVFSIMQKVDPSVIFINGIYSLPFTVYPLIYKTKARKILSVRGMLHPGALSQKALKKQIYLNMFRLFGLNKKSEYHSTTDEETQYIKSNFGDAKKVWTIPNLPNVLDYQQPLEKSVGGVTLMSVSLISPMKNILLVLQALLHTTAKIEYYIYGPVKDVDYWAECKRVMQTMPDNVLVEYKGEVQPSNVANALAKGHYFIMPSKSENFGHAIYEALSAGKPVITSLNTPWNNLQKSNAGYNVNPNNIEELAELIDNLTQVDNDEYTTVTKAAKEYISQQYDIEQVKQQYIQMFSA